MPDVNLTSNHADVTLTLAEGQRYPVLAVTGSDGHVYRFTLGADLAEELGTSLIVVAARGEAINDLSASRG